MALFGLGRKKLSLHPPFEGEVVTLDAVPDPVFAARMLGDGFAVRPAESATRLTVTAPVGGKLAMVFNTGHAFAVVSDEGIEVLVHIGIDTVECKGEGFVALAETGDIVTAGQPVVEVDPASVRAAGFDLITPVVFTNQAQIDSVEVSAGAKTPADVACKAKLA